MDNQNLKSDIKYINLLGWITKYVFLPSKDFWLGDGVILLLLFK